MIFSGRMPRLLQRLGIAIRLHCEAHDVPEEEPPRQPDDLR